jgi:amino acid adenylation domain-containing protein
MEHLAVAYRELSVAQTAIWLAQKLDPHNPVFNISECVEIFGKVDEAALAQAATAAYQAADAFHYKFAEIDGRPVQFYSPNREFTPQCVDLTSCGDAHGAAWEWMENDARQAGSLDGGAPLSQIAILRLSEEHLIFYHRAHHILLDGASGVLLFQEIERYYTSLTETGSLPASALGAFADVLDEEREYNRSPRFERDKAFWQQRLAGVTSARSLSGKSASAILPPGSTRTTRWIPDATVKRLRALGERCGASLLHVFTAVAAIYCRQIGDAVHHDGDAANDEVIIGVAVAGRVRKHTRGIPAMMSNTVPVRLGPSPGDLLGDVIAETARQVRDGMRHQLYRFENIHRDLQILPHQGSIFSLAVNFFSFDYASQFAGLPARSHNVALGPVADCQLSFYEGQSDSDVRLDIDGNSELYDAAALDLHLERIAALLASVAAAGESEAVQSLPRLPAAERARILVAWNATDADHGRGPCVHRLVEMQAARDPGALAVASGECTLTYGDLDARANRLAHHLVAIGVQPGSIVALCFERSPECIIAMLAVLKAGGTYLPLDPAFPVERLAFGLADSRAVVLLTVRTLFDRLPAFPVTFYLDTQEHALLERPDTAPQVPVALHDAAYAIYTSGSTGTPKAVIVEHASLVNLLRWHQQAYALTPADRTTQIAGPAFDASVWEIWPTLACGASLHIPSPSIKQDPALLIAWYGAQAITVTFLPTALAEATFDHAWSPTIPLRLMLTGGDQLVRRPPADVPFRLVNHYGPTEGTVVSTSGDVAPADQGSALPDIGRPIANTRVYILDSMQEPVPQGIVGEIHIAGAHLARGYLNRPQLMQERFLPDPFALALGRPEARMYRTGDLGRYNPDGTIEFLGRNDSQVKIRGFRIETGEIEATLIRHQFITEAIVIASKRRDGEVRLVAYVVAARGADADQRGFMADLRHFLRSSLPEYMVPAAFVVLPELPLTPNGKIDRAALPEPVEAGGDSAAFAPDTPLEQILHALWTEILGVADLGPDDNFFDVGGHSLQALKVVSALKDRANIDIPVRYMFESNSLRTLALMIEDHVSGSEHGLALAATGQGEEPAIDVPGLDMAPERPLIDQLLERQRDHLRHWDGHRHRADATILSHNTGGTRPALFWCFQGYNELVALANELGADQPVHGMRSGHMIMEYTEETVQALGAHYAGEMLELHPAGDFLIGGNCQAGIIAQRAAMILQAMGRNVAVLILMEQPHFFPYAGQVALLFGKDSTLNPYLTQSDPDESFRSFYDDRYTVDIISGTHGQFFEPANIGSLADAVRRRLAAATAEQVGTIEDIGAV